jgi:hypothetical protein
MQAADGDLGERFGKEFVALGKLFSSEWGVLGVFTLFSLSRGPDLYLVGEAFA